MSSDEDLYEHAPCGYLTTLPDGSIQRANQTFLAWTGYRLPDLVGRRRFPDLLTAGGRIYHETHYAPLLRLQGAVREIAVDIVCADGRVLPALVNSVLTTDAGGQPAEIRTTVFDATDRRRYERELLRARRQAEESEARAKILTQTLQASLIPPAPPAIDGLDIAAVYRPAGSGAEVGGDFYDVFETASGDWTVVIGDVCGKGPQAATVAALARHTIRAATIRQRRPSAVLSTVNEALLRQETERFCTIAYGRLRRDRAGRVRLMLTSGGHPLPLHVTGDDAPRLVGHPGSLIGVLAEPLLHDTTVELRPGDAVVFFTDGVTEGRRDGDFFGDERLAAVVDTHRADRAADLADRIVDEVVGFQAGEPRDDVAVLVLRLPADP